jgi:hypothetical protein
LDSGVSGWDLRSDGIVANLLDEGAFEVEHTGKAPVSDSMVFVQIPDLADDFVWHFGVVVRLADAISAFVECNENEFVVRHDSYCAGYREIKTTHPRTYWSTGVRFRGTVGRV